MKRPAGCVLWLGAVLLLAAGLRLVGLTRGHSEGAFYRFHPDEETLIEAALKLSDPFDPPLTAYGTAPMYLLRAAVEIRGAVAGVEAPRLWVSESAFGVFVLARLLAALLGCLSVALVHVLGRRFLSVPAAGLAALSMAVAPLAVQQAHFYTADAVFLPLSLLFFLFYFRALESGRWKWHLAAGAALGATAAVRLNGALLGMVLVCGYLLDGAGAPKARLRRMPQRLRAPSLWLAAAGSLLVLGVLQPFLLTDFSRLFAQRSTDDFFLSLRIATGDLLQPWTLADMHTTPYLHWWTSLWPQSVGWPLTLGFALGVLVAARRFERYRGAMLLWCGIYFLLIGGLHTKHVRYLLPLLPFFCLFAAEFFLSCWRASRPWRLPGRLAAAAAAAYTLCYGLAFAGLYAAEDSRIRAARWLEAQVPPASTLGVESGGFSLQRLLEGRPYKQVYFDLPRIFYAAPYMLCRTRFEFLRDRLQRMEYIVLVDVNRYLQFSAAPDWFPVAADFYRRLLAGELGFALVARFKNYPHLGGWEFKDEGAEPSFLGYEHPAVYIFKRREREVLQRALERWGRELEGEPACADALLRRAASRLRKDEWEQALRLLAPVRDRAPGGKLARLMEAECYRRAGKRRREIAARRRYRPENARGELAHLGNTQMRHFVPAASAASLVVLGLPELALQVLGQGASEARVYRSGGLEEMAQSYIEVARRFFAAGQMDPMEEALALSARIYGRKAAYNVLAIRAYERGERGRALELWRRSLRLDAGQADVQRRVGMALLEDAKQYAEALRHLERAVQLDSSLRAGLGKWLEAARRGVEEQR